MSKILSIDVGIINLGLILGTIENNKLTIEDLALVDITKYQNCKCSSIDHDKKISNYMKHVFIEFKHFFEADIILIERQPLCGLVSVEQVICYEFPKAILISPNAVHKHFNMSHLKYDLRKVVSIKIAKQFLSKFEYYNLLERKHDLSDAVCMILYYMANDKIINKDKEINKEINKEIIYNTLDNDEEVKINGMFDMFIYNPL